MVLGTSGSRKVKGKTVKASKRRIRNSEHKGEIREKYKGIDPSEIEVIPANEESDLDIENRKMKVAAYVRVSTQNDEQTSSFELQVNDFTKRINENPNWEFAGIYSDEGISGTELSHRAGMLSLIEDAKAGKVQLILVKSIARFARNVVDCLSIVQELKNYGVGVCFDENNLCTLGAEGTMLLTILATVAEEESRSKSFIMNWSVQRRFQNGIFLTPELLGYDNDEDGGLMINESEAETVKVIYYLYVNGWSSKEIADLLTDYQRETKLDNTEWKSSWITQIIDNERHCGDVLAHKTYTPDFKTHKAVKNDGKLPKYRKRDHHDAIISRDVFNAAQLIRSSAFYKRKKHALPVLSVVEDGALKGYVPIDRNWEGFSPEDYQKACESVQTAIEKEEYVQSGLKLNLNGYQRVSSHFFPSSDDLSLTISGGKMRFSTACLKKFEDVEYVELLINTVNNCIAIRPCESDNPNAIHWGRLKEDKWIVNSMSCRGLAKVIFSLMSWEDDGKYRFKGEFRSNGSDKLLLFELDEPVVSKTVEQVIIPEKDDEEQIVVQETVRVYPPSWGAGFGTPIVSIARGHLLSQQHYSGDWDVLRPAKVIEEMNALSSETLAELMKEAETIMEGWDLGYDRADDADE